MKKSLLTFAIILFSLVAYTQSFQGENDPSFNIEDSIYQKIGPSRLLKAGVFNIPFLRHPILLETQMFFRANTYYSGFVPYKQFK